MTTRPTRPPCLWVSAIRHPPQHMQPLTIVITLIVSNVSIPIHALIDSGSAGNFISGNLCRQLKIHTTANSKVYQVQSITGRALSRHDVRLITEPITLHIGNLHEEDIKLLVLEEANTDIILGRPWFVLHEPQISCRTGDVLKWGDQCFPDCFPNLPRPSRPVSQTLSLNSTSIESPIEKQSVEIPEYYAHFTFVLRKPHNFHLIGHGTARSICYKLSQCPKGRFIHFHSQNRRPWRSTLRRLSNMGTSALPHPLLLPAYFSSPKRTGA